MPRPVCPRCRGPMIVDGVIVRYEPFCYLCLWCGREQAESAESFAQRKKSLAPRFVLESGVT